MFRLIDASPEYYLQQSRDFQYLTRLMDIWFRGFKFDADMILKMADPLSCPDEYLQALSEKIGFYPRKHIENEDLRIILKAFPWMYKYKGSRKAIDMAVRIGLMLNGIAANASQLRITINNMEVEVSTRQKIDETAIREMFRHIAPVGYALVFVIQEQQSTFSDVNYGGDVRLVAADKEWGSQVWGSGDNDDSKGGVMNYAIPVLYQGATTQAEIASIKEINTDGRDTGLDNEDGSGIGLDNKDGIIQRLEAASDKDIPDNAMFATGKYATIYLQEEVIDGDKTILVGDPLPEDVVVPDYVKFTTNKQGYENVVLCTWHECINGQWWRVVGRIDIQEIYDEENTVYWFRNILGMVEITDPDNTLEEGQEEKIYDEVIFE